MTSHDPPRVPPSLSPCAEPPPPEAVPPWPEPEPEGPRRWTVRRVLFWTFLVLTVLFFTPPAVVLALRWLPPPTTAFMLQSPVQPVQYRWVPAERIPETLRRAVIAAEDQKFWTHWGFDFMAIAEALEHNEKNRRRRGASTITQQVAKNLFLWPSRSYLRKGLEVTFTILLELTWPKERILEVYLNVAEFGPGVYGVEAAARKFFGKSAQQLTPPETAQLAAVLPNPRNWRADQPGPYVQARTDWILGQIGYRPRFSFFPEEEEPEPTEPLPAEPGLEPTEEAEPYEEAVPGEAPPAEEDFPAEAPEAEAPSEPVPPDAETQPEGSEEPTPEPEPTQAP